MRFSYTTATLFMVLSLANAGQTQELFERPTTTPDKPEKITTTPPGSATDALPNKDTPGKKNGGPGEPPGKKTAPPATPDKPADATPPAVPAPAATEDKTCLYCDQSEQLVVDLNYYKQVVDILKEIDNARKDISPTMLKSIHALLTESHPGLIDLLRATPPKTPAPALPAKPATKTPAATKKKPQPIKRTRTGIEGLTLKHVNEQNPHTNTAARIIVDSNGISRFLYEDSRFTHNNNSYQVTAIEKLDNDPGGRGHQVKIKNTKTNRTYTVPW